MKILKHRRLLLLGFAYLAFVSLGLPDGLLGVAWPSMRAFFKLLPDALGPLLIITTSGYLLASFSSGKILSRISVGALLAWSCLATGGALLGYALTPSWWLLVAFGLFAGLGAGAIDTGLNTYAATHFSARAINWLHAFYGIGATLGPAIMTSVLEAGKPWQAGYTIVGITQVVLAVCFGTTRKLWSDNRPETALVHQDHAGVTKTSPAALVHTLGLPRVWLGIAIFFIYTGIEATAGAWTFSLLTEGRSMAVVTAGTGLSVYWSCLTGGRLLAGLIANFVTGVILLRYCSLGIAAGAVLLWLDLANLASLAGVALIGLFCAPVFPAMIAMTSKRVGASHTANAIGFQMAATVLGAALIPGFTGVLVTTFSLEILAPVLLVMALLLLVLHEMSSGMTSKPAGAAAQKMASAWDSNQI